jgi:hypothetical protein
MLLLDLLKSLRANPLVAHGPRGRRCRPAATFRPGVESLDERCLLSAAPSVRIVVPTLEAGHLGLLRAFQEAQHLGPLYAALPDLGAGATAAAPNTFVGRVPGTNLAVGVVLGPREALAYVCDSATTTAWLRGKVRGEALALSGEGGSRITAQVQGDEVAGALALHGGPALAFTALRAVDGHSGLFRSAVRVGRQQGVLSSIRLPGYEPGAVNTQKGAPVSFIDPLGNL